MSFILRIRAIREQFFKLDINIYFDYIIMISDILTSFLKNNYYIVRFYIFVYFNLLYLEDKTCK